ncbi:hypothetical protein OV203_25395 [Nannocystis sp. ILAH1]|uniref:hypothetical protein n=1 Tax=Nannocystis sp. ILAH1 TaxID=2996789 RepID=UPI0022703EB1|nr:hypothetical protein [Nannocystis sp. ILAH1]MCY0990502.1 hypothetical protein [Nannocystis sp. ILAH1]
MLPPELEPDSAVAVEVVSDIVPEVVGAPVVSAGPVESPSVDPVDAVAVVELVPVDAVAVVELMPVDAVAVVELVPIVPSLAVPEWVGTPQPATIHPTNATRIPRCIPFSSRR